MDSVRDSVAVKRRVGYLPGELAGFPGVTAGYVIGLLAGLRGGVDPDRIGALADRFRIDLGRKYETLSHGNKQKAGLIQAFMHEPELLILDEPARFSAAPNRQLAPGTARGTDREDHRRLDA
jgi:ABC-2 type transport system ATP-binding protein